MANKNKTSKEHYEALEEQIKVLKELGLIGSGGVCEIVSEDDIYNVSYNEVLVAKTKQNRSRKIPLTPEELARVGVIKSISEQNYSEKDFLIEKPYELGRSKTDKSKRLDISLNYKDGECYAVIEVKQKTEFNYQTDKDIEGQLFNIASIQNSCQGKPVEYLVYSTSYVDDQSKELIADLVVIDYKRYPSYQKWVDDGRKITNTLPVDYDKENIRPITNGDNLPTMTTQEISKLKTQIHNKLYAGGGVPDNLIFTTIVNAFLCKLHDEETTPINSPYIFQYAYGENEDAFKDKINKLYREALTDKFKFVIDAKDESKYQVTDFSKVKVKQLITLVELIQRYDISTTISTANYDILGDFFESISRDQFKQTKGQFFTHQKIVDFIIDICDLESLADSTLLSNKLPYIADLSAGSGTFLISAMKSITKIIEDKKSNPTTKKLQNLIETEWAVSGKKNKWAQDYIYGTEKDIDLGTAIKVNMILHGDGQAHIGVGSEQGDGLAKLNEFKSNLKISQQIVPPNIYEKETLPIFDLILSNPPFSVSLDAHTKNGVENTFMLHSGVDSELLFIERYFQTLKPYGRVGIVIPESVLDGDNNTHARFFIIKHFKIRGVISFPENTFVPFTTVKTSGLFLERRLTPLTNDELDNLLKPDEEFISLEKKQMEALGGQIQDGLKNILSIRNEKTFYCKVEELGYKRRKGKPELTKKNSDLNTLVELFKANNFSIWDDSRYPSNIGGTVRLPQFLMERTVRLDYSYNSQFNFIPEQIDGNMQLSSIIGYIQDCYYREGEGKTLIKNIKAGLANPIEYCEINNIDRNGYIISTNEINDTQDEDEHQEIYNKIRKNDILKTENVDILMSSVRPYLNKNVLIDTTHKDLYFTKAFIALRVFDGYDRLAVYHFIKARLSAKVNAVARYGKSYPTLKETDLLNIYLSLADIGHLLALCRDRSNLEQRYQSIADLERLLKQKKEELSKL